VLARELGHLTGFGRAEAEAGRRMDRVPTWRVLEQEGLPGLGCGASGEARGDSEGVMVGGGVTETEVGRSRWALVGGCKEDPLALGLLGLDGGLGMHEAEVK
jgi:hypothetical protein